MLEQDKRAYESPQCLRMSLAAAMTTGFKQGHKRHERYMRPVQIQFRCPRFPADFPHHTQS
jgi:hypothetical protein